jgi:hypothetical protein
MRFPLPVESREVAEALFAAGEADVPQETIVELHEVTSGAACLDRLVASSEEEPRSGQGQQ